MMQRIDEVYVSTGLHHVRLVEDLGSILVALSTVEPRKDLDKSSRPSQLYIGTYRCTYQAGDILYSRI